MWVLELEKDSSDDNSWFPSGLGSLIVWVAGGIGLTVVVIGVGILCVRQLRNRKAAVQAQPPDEELLGADDGLLDDELFMDEELTLDDDL